MICCSHAGKHQAREQEALDKLETFFPPKQRKSFEHSSLGRCIAFPTASGTAGAHLPTTLELLAPTCQPQAAWHWNWNCSKHPGTTVSRVLGSGELKGGFRGSAVFCATPRWRIDCRDHDDGLQAAWHEDWRSKSVAVSPNLLTKPWQVDTPCN